MADPRGPPPAYQLLGQLGQGLDDIDLSLEEEDIEEIWSGSEASSSHDETYDESLFGEFEDTPEGKQRTENVLGRFLDLENPRISSKMEEFLSNSDVFLMLLDFVVRHPSEDHSFEGDVNKARDWKNEDAMVRSYRVTQLLAPSPPVRPLIFINSLLITNTDMVVKRLLLAFSSHSDANFHHVHLLLACLFRINGNRAAKAFLSHFERHEGRVVECLIQLSHYGGVLPILQEIMQPSASAAPRANDISDKQKESLARLLSKHDFVAKTAKVLSTCPEESCDDMARALVRLYGESGLAYSFPLINDNADVHAGVASLVETATNLTFSSARRTSAMNVLKAILSQNVLAQGRRFEGSGRTVWSRGTVQHFHQFLAPLGETINALSTPKHYATGVKLAGHNVKHAFTEFRLAVVSLFYDILLSAVPPQETQEHAFSVMEKVPGLTWRTLVELFFNYPHHNLYHSIFYKTLVLLSEVGHEPTLSSFYSKTKLVNRLFEHLKTGEKTSARGFVLLISNYLRLRLEVDGKSSYVGNMLVHHPQWLANQEFLRSKTVTDLGTRGCTVGMEPKPSLTVMPRGIMPNGMPMMPASGLCPRTPLFYGPETIASKTPPERTDSLAFRQPESIDVGSRFAYHLGVVSVEEQQALLAKMQLAAAAAKPSDSPSASPRLQRKATHAPAAPAPAAAPQAQAAHAPEPEAGKKKKNKRKKKKKSTGANQSEEGGEEEEEDDGEGESAESTENTPASADTKSPQASPSAAESTSASSPMDVDEGEASSETGGESAAAKKKKKKKKNKNKGGNGVSLDGDGLEGESADS